MKKTVVTVLAFLAFCGCGIAAASGGKVFTQTDKEIPAATHNQINQVNLKILASIASNDPTVMINSFVEDARSDSNLRDNIRETYNNLSPIVRKVPLELLHEYYIDAKEAGGPATIKLPADKDNNFLINVQDGKGALYICLFVSKGNFKDIMLCLAYLHTKTGWFLHTFHCGVYKVAGKTPVDWYEDAKEMSEKGWLIPAMLRMQLVQSFVRPVPFIIYDKEKEMEEFAKKGAMEAGKMYKFPIKAGKGFKVPLIYGFDSMFVKEKFVPVIIYVTKIALNKGEALNDEASGMNWQIDKIFPGITEGGEVVYRAFSEPPLDKSKGYKYRDVPIKL